MSSTGTTSATSTKLSAPMRAALAKLVEHGGVAEYRTGGFWTFPTCESAPGAGIRVPAWYTTTHTVKALVARGLMTMIRDGASFDNIGIVTIEGFAAVGRVKPRCAACGGTFHTTRSGNHVVHDDSADQTHVVAEPRMEET